jgi:hypothetical protein
MATPYQIRAFYLMLDKLNQSRAHRWMSSLQTQNLNPILKDWPGRSRNQILPAVNG